MSCLLFVFLEFGCPFAILEVSINYLSRPVTAMNVITTKVGQVYCSHIQVVVFTISSSVGVKLVFSFYACLLRIHVLFLCSAAIP